MAMGLYVLAHFRFWTFTHARRSKDGMFAIMVPATLSPLILVLLWAERKAKKLGLVPVKKQMSFKARVWDFIEQLNVVGLVLFGTAVALILLPLTLSQTANNGWKNRASL